MRGNDGQMASKTRTFFLNAISLTATALIMRAVSVIFNIFVSKSAGSEAMGLFSLLGSVYAFSITLGSAGINLGTTRLVSDALALNDTALAKRSMRRALLCCLFTGAAATALLFSLSEPLAIKVLNDRRALSSLRILSLSIVPVAVCSCLSGYFTGVRRVKMNAAFGVFAQMFKIGATLFFLSLIEDSNAESACKALVLGITVSEVLSLAVSFSLYIFDKKKLKTYKTQKTFAADTLGGAGHQITKKLLSITLPVTASACIRSALSMVQHILIPKGIHANGKSWSAALSSYGALHGMAMPLLLFPSALIYAFAGLLIPEVSECCAQSNTERLRRVSYRALSFSLFFSIGVSGIILCFSRELGLAIYNNEETALYIRMLAPLIPVMYIDGAVDAILKGSGHQVYSMNVNIIDTLTACLFAITLIPKIGIMGYVISIYATEILNTTLSLIKMISVSRIRPRIFHQVFMPIICVIGATNASRLALRFFGAVESSNVKLVAGIIIAIVIYILLLFITRTVTSEEQEFLNASLLSEKQYDLRFGIHEAR
jgi:stage V sporulation protein B